MRGALPAAPPVARLRGPRHHVAVQLFPAGAFVVPIRPVAVECGRHGDIRYGHGGIRWIRQRVCAGASDGTRAAAPSSAAVINRMNGSRHESSGGRDAAAGTDCRARQVEAAGGSRRDARVAACRCRRSGTTRRPASERRKRVRHRYPTQRTAREDPPCQHRGSRIRMRNMAVHVAHDRRARARLHAGHHARSASHAARPRHRRLLRPRVRHGHDRPAHAIDTAANDWIGRLSASSTTTRNLRQYDMDAKSRRQRPHGPAQRRDGAPGTRRPQLIAAVVTTTWPKHDRGFMTIPSSGGHPSRTHGALSSRVTLTGWNHG